MSGRGNKSPHRKAVESLDIGECVTLPLAEEDRKKSAVTIRQMLLTVEKTTGRWYARRSGQHEVQVARIR